MAYGGLRGAVGFSLVTILPEANPMKDIFLTTTLVMIFFTVFIQGGTIKLLVSKLKITKKAEEEKSIGKDVNLKMIDNVMAGVESVMGRNARYSMLEKFRNFDKKYIKRVLLKKDAGRVLGGHVFRLTITSALLIDLIVFEKP